MIFSVSFLLVATAAVFTVSRIRCPMIQKHPENKDSNIESDEKEEEEEQSLKCKLQLNDTKVKNSKCVRKIEFLKDAATKMDKRREKLEVKLLEFYCLKQQHIEVGAHLRKLLKSKILEIHMLNATKTSLQFEKERLKEGIKQNQFAEKQLESGRASLKEIQGQECVESAQLKGQLLMLTEQLSGFGIEEKGESLELKEKLIATKNVELELEAIEFKRKKKELQLDMRELGVKLVSAQSNITAFSRFSESHIIGELEAEKRRLMHSNEVFSDNIEKLQINRFDMVQELVYQRWLNACLRFEIKESQTPVKHNHNKLSFESEEASSIIFSVESEETTDTAATSYSSSQTSTRKRYNIAQKLKNWVRIKKGSDQRGLIRRFSMSSVPSSATREKNIVTKSPNADKLKRLRRVSFSDSVGPSKMEFQDTQRPMNKEGNTKATTGTKANRKGLLGRFSMSSVPSVASLKPAKNQVLELPESYTRRAKRVSFDDMVEAEPLAFCNVTEYTDINSDCEKVSSKIYTSGSDLELKNTQEISSTSLQKREDEIENQVSSETKHSDQLMDVAAAAVIIIFFILLVILFLSSICR